MKNNGRITAYIHMDAEAWNFEKMKENLKDGTKMVAVVKTDGYGHGAVPIARLAENYEYIWGFAVAAVSEAMELRKAGIQKPILILGYTFEEDYRMMAANGIRPAIFTLQMAEAFSRAAEEEGITSPLHIAVDTGMSRIGVEDNENGIALVKQIH